MDSRSEAPMLRAVIGPSIADLANGDDVQRIRRVLLELVEMNAMSEGMSSRVGSAMRHTIALPMSEESDLILYTVVVNDEEQYSIWPTDRSLPNGWRAVGQTGTRQACLDYIAKVWTDMRPASMRRAIKKDSSDS